MHRHTHLLNSIHASQSVYILQKLLLTLVVLLQFILIFNILLLPVREVFYRILVANAAKKTFLGDSFVLQGHVEDVIGVRVHELTRHFIEDNSALWMLIKFFKWLSILWHTIRLYDVERRMPLGDSLKI